MGLAGDLLAALAIFDDRLPELFGGHARELADVPVPYGTACWSQAWAVVVPLAIVALCLELQPDVPAGTVIVNPVLPRGVRHIEIHGVPFPGGELFIAHDADGTKVFKHPRTPGRTHRELRPRRCPEAPMYPEWQLNDLQLIMSGDVGFVVLSVAPDPGDAIGR